MPADGESLAKAICSSCHSFPSPELLDKNSWSQYILPRMGHLLGIYETAAERTNLIAEDIETLSLIYPEEALIDFKKWMAIKKYYLENAPDTLASIENERQTLNPLKHFQVIAPKVQFKPPSTTLLQFGNREEIFLGDAHSQSFFQLDHQLNIKNAAKVKEGAVHLHETTQHYWVTVMGSFSPNDKNQGMILKLPKNKNEGLTIPIQGLKRPVHSTYADLTGDGKDDIIVCEYGKWAGQLSLFIQQVDSSYEKKVLLNQTGAIRTKVHDFDRDGRMDIISLFGQGKEAIYIHYNRGDGHFDTESVIDFSPSNGSSYFDLQDFDQDGNMDILYCAGDNADFPPINKPYHGVYFFKNDGQNNFTKSFFYPIKGAYKAIVRDFDLDSDLDIAVISFFPDFLHSANKGFLLLERTENGYIERSFENANLGRWISMDAKDYDGDGDEDLIIGSLAFEAPGRQDLLNQWANNGLPFLLLKNTVR